jgi:hypothetical protein
MSEKTKMTPSRKGLLIVSIIYVVVAILYIALGVVSFACGSDSGILNNADLAKMAAESNSSVQEMFAAAAITMIVYGVFEGIVALLGIRGARNPRKMGLITVIYGIAAALAMVSLLIALFTRNIDLSIVQSIIPIVGFFLCMKIRQEAKAN